MTATMVGRPHGYARYRIHALADVDGTGTARRVRALCALGWPLDMQADRIGWDVADYQTLTEVRPVPARTVRVVTDLYDQLSMLVPADTAEVRLTRQQAAAQGWVPPLAWDDDEIDKPAALPATTPGNGIGLLAAWVVNYRDAAGQGLDRQQIAERLEISAEAVKDRLRRARRNGLIEAAPRERKRPVKARRQPAPCGTPAAYKRHCSNDEPIDADCREARRDYLRRHRSANNSSTTPGGAS